MKTKIKMNLLLGNLCVTSKFSCNYFSYCIEYSLRTILMMHYPQ